MNKFTLAIAAGAFALAGCTEGGDPECDSGQILDSAGICVDDVEPAYEGPWQINTVSWNCDTTSGDYTYSVRTDGWANTVTLDIFETGSWDGTNDASVWDEQHTMDNTEYADDGSWDQWDLTLAPAVDSAGEPDIGEQVSGETTLWTCGTHGDAELAWMATMDAVNDTTDCGVWGNEAVDWFNTDQGNSCFDFNP